MSVETQQLSWQKRAQRRSAIRAATRTSERQGLARAACCTSSEPLSRLSSDSSEFTFKEFFNTTFLKESPEDKLANEVLEHCFQQHKLQEKHPHFFFKLKASRFGPPKSRRRILIAPPMEGMAPSSPAPQLPMPPVDAKEKVHALEEPPAKAKAPAGDDLQNVDAWIEERKKLQDLLNSCVDLEKWLTVKQPISDQEESVLGKMRECRRVKEANAAAQLTAISSIQHLIPKRPLKKVIPTIDAPFPDSLLTLQNMLQKYRLKLVDIFNKVDKSRTMKFKRKDFLKVMQETKVPISPGILEDAVVHLTLKKRNYITADDLAECQRIWQTSLRDQWKQSKQAKRASPATSAVSPVPASACGKSKPVQPPVPGKLSLLQVPPINTEPDAMHLSYSQMEMVGKRNRDMRRLLKKNISPLEWIEKCRMVKTGDLAVDGHCLPSTIEGEMGEVVDKYRLATHLVYTRCVKLCEARGIPISEKILKRALLYPGDRIIKDGENVRKLRQPGGAYGSIREVSSDEESRSSSEEKERVPKKKTAKKKRVRETKPLTSRWKSFAEFKSAMKHSKQFRLSELWTALDDGGKTRRKSRGSRGMSIQREMMRRYALLNPLTTPNCFWPGHLLDKLHLYMPETQGDEAEVLFSRVSPARPVYPATYSPDRNWPVNDQGYVTYGDPDSRKEYYYI